MSDAYQRLSNVLSQFPRLTIAVSGGVDSLTLATIAARQLKDTTIAHAISPAVPDEATDRVRAFASSEGWDLRVINAREFSDPNYLKNPTNRCYFCKSNLYSRIAESCSGPIASGTNTDDLGEYRPGLIAAKEQDVVHPYVMADISKRELRDLASGLGLSGIAALPAQPCLASRIETGIAIDAADLAFVHAVEKLATERLSSTDIRCRVTKTGIRLETNAPADSDTIAHINAFCQAHDRVFDGAYPYRRGSAFLQGEAV
ncbi:MULTISPECIES: adenine nucleotide alpha hydrolase [Halocynthiibacter]|uniref:Adenine nucleotide alpha hydrolase n=1 Tax=Halocynthiibacter halioticoli TaxID=2986804 RepID=A0AAE3J1P1_9RHOB|nr:MULTISPECIES: adenine nucleotide alpha hydrolase [Halocynthiibacter]MCV6824491.1 adenine nucleotide alpha hydrolase [Halocynthiibacter halioticoli]MCW4057492.1 adenine nucleotide alpha hydrolase [Halocynthiibacter sp. SDUM655004]